MESADYDKRQTTITIERRQLRRKHDDYDDKLRKRRRLKRIEDDDGNGKLREKARKVQIRKIALIMASQQCNYRRRGVRCTEYITITSYFTLKVIFTVVMHLIRSLSFFNILLE